MPPPPSLDPPRDPPHDPPHHPPHHPSHHPSHHPPHLRAGSTRRALRRPSAVLASMLIGCAALAGAAAQAAVLLVGPGPGDLAFVDALRQARDGDAIHVAAGHYPGQVAVIGQRRLTIVGTGERPVFSAAGRHAEGKAIWVVRDGDIRIENIEFRGARVPDGNGAGIRFQRGRLTLVRCAFFDNQMGLLTANEPDSVLDIDASEFGQAPVNPGTLAHLLYVGRIAEFTLRKSSLHGGREGHLLKSRARKSLIVDNRLDDGDDGQASYEIDLPNGGLVRVERNTIGQSALTQNPVMLSFGAEGDAWPRSSLTLVDNRFVNRLGPRGVFVRVWSNRLPADATVSSRFNRLLGEGRMQLGPNASAEGDRRGPLPADRIASPGAVDLEKKPGHHR